jgi:O-antigen ligase
LPSALQKEKTEKSSLDEWSPPDFLSPLQNNLLLFFACLLAILPPLFHLHLAQDEWVDGFIPIRIVNADLKFVLVLALGSVLVGIALVSLHLGKKVLAIPKSLQVFLGLFLIGVMVSCLFAHNGIRAWVSSIRWHFLPILFALSLAHVSWSRNKLGVFLGALLLGGILSSLVVMDQHYFLTDWSHRLPRHTHSIPAGIIFNHNFAAEYHAPLLPLCLGALFYFRNLPVRILLGAFLFLVFLPALSLSLARGAWLGMLFGSVLSALCFLIILFLKRKTIVPAVLRPSGMLASAFIALSLALPLFLYTSSYWKKSEPSSMLSSPSIAPSTPKEAKEFESIIPTAEGGGSNRRFVLWQDALNACLSEDFLFGKGTDHYELHFHESAELSDAAKSYQGILVRHAHNDFIQALYENGIVGLIGFLGIWWVVLWRGLLSSLACAKKRDLRGLGLRLGLIAACLTFLAEAFFEFPARSPCAVVVAWSALGVLLGLVLREPAKPHVPAPQAFSPGPRFNLFLGAAGILIVPAGFLLAKDLFWANVYHYQGRIAAGYGEKDKSLKFHRLSIAHAPWEHHSRKKECYYLLTHKKQFPEALEALNATLAVHPGCLVAHENKIRVLLREFGNRKEAKLAYFEMRKAAPFHPYTHRQRKKFPELK